MKSKTHLFPVAAALLIGVNVVGAQECYQSTILRPSPFMGNNDEVFKLSDGSVWQVKYEYEYVYECSPEVIICPRRGKLIIRKKSLNVEQMATGKARQSPRPTAAASGKWEVYEETNLQGSISGTVKQGSIFKTMSGNVYEVTRLTLQLILELGNV